MNAEFKARVRSLTVTELRRAYPGEANCHRAILARVQAGGAEISKQLKSFKNFLLELGPRPNKDWTVDRIDTLDPEYASGKLRWADKRQQANNRTNTIFLNVRGEIKPLTDWARRTGQNPNTIRQRLRRDGGSHEEAVYPKSRSRKNSEQPHVAESAGGWPAALTPQNWEPHYLRCVDAFRSARGNPLTRTVFALWVESSIAVALFKDLTAKYPGQFSAESCPDDDNPQIDDPLYKDFLLHDGIRQELLGIATPAERQFWKGTLRSHGVLKPKDAANLVRKWMKSRSGQ